MDAPFESRHPLVGLVDETSRLAGRLKSLFAASRQAIGLGESEIMVLNAVVEASRAPTAAQIGRSLGHPRQLIQRAVNALMADGLIEAAENPDHKRAALLLPTAQGIALKRRADTLADQIAAGLDPAINSDAVRQATETLSVLRRQLEAGLRARS